MSGAGHAILGYAIGLGLLWGYALTRWEMGRRFKRRSHGKGTN